MGEMCFAALDICSWQTVLRERERDVFTAAGRLLALGREVSSPNRKLMKISQASWV